MGESFSPIISHFAFYFVFFFLTTPLFTIIGELKLIWRLSSRLFDHNNIKRARFISISVSYEILSEVRIFILYIFSQPHAPQSPIKLWLFVVIHGYAMEVSVGTGLSRFLTLIHRNGLKIVESCLHFFSSTTFTSTRVGLVRGRLTHSHTITRPNVNYVICFVSNKKRNSFMEKKWVWMSISWWHDNVKTILMERLLPAMHLDHQS